ncbi:MULTISPECIES: hypothetical protein [unclassified Microbacterium]|uniref:hypothetical protein n=1 Tax=unclassified Microbacterium TaxID=2609290 RepID=UPI00214AD229|nr:MULTISPECIES: hypothetical protein [unclassified Microbacterium]MCR2783647.1 hypothetical protein [Microbacterium sp. zg.B96]WIM15495.1 hypothetical protein QNO11_13280 [Microbacterium sp. zg-B96]
MSKTQTDPRSKQPEPATVPVWMRALVPIGIGLAVIGALVVGALLLIFSLVHRISSLHPDEPVPAGFIGLTGIQLEALESFAVAPAILFLVSMCFIFTGRALCGPLYVRDMKWFQGGTFVSINPILAPRLHLMWVAVATAFFVALAVVPSISSILGGWPNGLQHDAWESVTLLLAMYGGLAAAITAVLLASFLKKSSYLAMVQAEDPRMLQASSGFWRWMTFRWRFDLWLAGIGGMAVGISFFILTSGDVTAFAIGMAIGAVLLGLGLWCSTQYWRGGVPLGAGESYV